MKVLIVIATVKNIFKAIVQQFTHNILTNSKNKDLFILASAAEQNSMLPKHHILATDG